MFNSFDSLTSSYRHSSTNLWAVLFHIEGNILFRVLPFCIINCTLLALVHHFHQKDNFGFSATGHGLLTLLVSFLVINKVNLAYERFRLARTHVGDAFLHLRELNQLLFCFSSACLQRRSSEAEHELNVKRWTSEHVANTIQLLDCVKLVVQNERFAKYLARNKQKYLNEDPNPTDPLTLVHSIRLHLYSSDFHLELLERICLVNKLDSFLDSYRHLLELASTPLPFAMVQMGRAFLFVWTFSMPLVLLQGPFTDLGTAMIFLFFLTYGFVGLELVSMKLASPFGDGIHDIQVTSLRDATVIGIEQDMQLILRVTQQSSDAFERRLQFQKLKQPQNNVPAIYSGHSTPADIDAAGVAMAYHVMLSSHNNHSTSHML